jgi:SPX domain protein involved in polyphosphate accumulation
MHLPWKRPVESNWRFEYKYRISPWQYHQVRNALVPYMMPDEHTRVAPADRYLVRSLYFDTYDYQAFHEKMGGDFGRIKIRIRSYTKTMSEETPIRVELKTRRGSAMEKFSSFVPAAYYTEFIQTGHWPAEDSPVLTEFERLYYLRALRPKLLVEYHREGLKSRSREDLRITFDFDVHSAGTATLFPETIFFRDHHPNVITLEIKCRNQQPTWLSKLVRQHGLKWVANSKYTRGIEVSRPDVITPMWSQGYADTGIAALKRMHRQHQAPSFSASETLATPGSLWASNKFSNINKSRESD